MRYSSVPPASTSPSTVADVAPVSNDTRSGSSTVGAGVAGGGAVSVAARGAVLVSAGSAVAACSTVSVGCGALGGAAVGCAPGRLQATTANITKAAASVAFQFIHLSP